MGRIIAFKAPAYHSTSRATSPANDSDSETLCTPSYKTLERPTFEISRVCGKVSISHRLGFLRLIITVEISVLQRVTPCHM